MILDFNREWLLSDGKNKKTVNLPHDAMLGEKRNENCHNSKQSGYFPGGNYTYKKQFEISEADIEKQIELLFEGVYQNCKVFINDKEVCCHKYGYTEFKIAISKFLIVGLNTVTVTVDNSLEPNCRWYSGSGIYRPVWMLVNELEEPEIYTKSYNPAVINVNCDNETEVEIFDGITSVYKGKGGEIQIKNAKLWSEENPYLYTCIAKKGDLETKTTFGIRKLSWDTKNGLCVNGERILLRGGCIHHDNGILGACGFAEAERRRIKILKEAGYNAIRSAHNPMSRIMLDACDEIGMYVMDECFDGWYTPKNYHDYSRYFYNEWKKDLASMIKKDLNHPSVIMYSIGNEVSETHEQKGVDICGELAEFVRNIDKTRPVTCGVNVLLNVYANFGLGVYKEKGDYKAEPLPEKNKHYREKKTGSAFFNAMAQKLGGLMFFMSKGKKGDKACRGAAEKLDIIGFNYAGSRFEEDVINYPNRMMVASETMVTDLPYNWERVKKYPAVVGDFVWAAWDYLGEAGVGDWTYHSYKGLPLLAGSGTIDITGKITAESYYQQVIWGLYDKPYICVQPVNHSKETPTKSSWRFTNAIDSWTWHGFENEKAVVEVFSNAYAIKLVLNGKEIATRKLKKFKTKFTTEYQGGTLEAIALDKSGNEISKNSLVTGEKNIKLTVKPDKTTLKADGQDLCFIPIEFTDKNGELLPYMEQSVSVKVDGVAVLQGLGSALCKTDERYDSNTFTSFRGRVLAVVRSGYEKGNVKVTIESEGLKSVTANLEVI